MSAHTIADPDASISRDDLELLARKGAAALGNLGAEPDDAVAIIMRNDLASVEIMRAVALAGVVGVPLNCLWARYGGPSQPIRMPKLNG